MARGSHSREPFDARRNVSNCRRADADGHLSPHRRNSLPFRADREPVRLTPMMEETSLNDEIVVRAWADKSYRASLSDEDLKRLPPHPSGEPTFSMRDLAMEMACSTYKNTVGVCCTG